MLIFSPKNSQSFRGLLIKKRDAAVLVTATVPELTRSWADVQSAFKMGKGNELRNKPVKHVFLFRTLWYFPGSQNTTNLRITWHLGSKSCHIFLYFLMSSTNLTFKSYW